MARPSAREVKAVVAETVREATANAYKGNEFVEVTPVTPLQFQIRVKDRDGVGPSRYFLVRVSEQM